jgi:DNA mismatch repair protein MutL
LAVSRHATSKLASAKELFSISTLGFRGEALASIGSVSRMTMTSCVTGAEIGARIRVEGGQEGTVKQTGVPVGTVVQVENLFYNVPARLKFLKSDTTERRAIDTFVTRYALAYPDVRFKLAEGKKVTLQTSGDGDRRAILAILYGVETAKQMLEVIAEDDGLKLSGYISPTSITRSNRREMTFFINGRWVQDIPLNAALTQAYHTLLMVGRYPLATLPRLQWTSTYILLRLKSVFGSRIKSSALCSARYEGLCWPMRLSPVCHRLRCGGVPRQGNTNPPHLDRSTSTGRWQGMRKRLMKRKQL